MLPLGATMLLHSSARPIVGNYLLTVPNGIAIVWSPTAAAAIDCGGEYVAGVAAPDDSYHRQELTLGGKRVVLEWGRSGPGAIGRISSPESEDLTIKFPQTWPGISTTYRSTPDGCVAESGGKAASFVIRPAPAHADETGATLHLQPSVPIHFSFGLATLPSNADIDKQLGRAKAAYDRLRPWSQGDWSDFLNAIPANLNNSRIYAADEDRIAHSVSRGWAGGNPNNAPYFCWDSFFNGALSCLDDPVTARATVRTILSWQIATGLVPNYGHWNQSDGSRSSDDRSQPPVGSMCIWKMHQRWPDVAFLKEVYPRLLRWHRWWPKYRDGDHDGLLEWGSEKVGKQGALWETGWDDTPQYADSEMVGTTLDTDAVDLNALWSMDAQYLSYIADAVGDKSTAKELRDEQAHTNRLINDRLWNTDLGIYCSRKWDSKGGQFLTRLTPMNFYPLICGAASSERAKSTLAVLTDPKRFWGDWILPTVSFEDPVWKQQTYWHGTVWAPVNFLVLQGLHRYASPELLAEYGRKSVSIFMKNWTSDGYCGENFGSDTGLVDGDKHYTWGALMCLVGLESICYIEPDGRVTLNGAQTAKLTLHNVPIRGRRYTVETGPGWAKLELGDRVVLEAHGTKVTERI
jgi:hypothetical protein